MNLRKGLIVWLYTLRGQRDLKKFGNIYYVSRKMKYVVMYVDKKDTDKIVKKVSQLKFVKKVELSHRDEIDMDFESKIGSSGVQNKVLSE